MKAVAARKATVKRGRSYAAEKGVPIFVVREEPRSYPESTDRLIGQLGDLRNHQTALPRIARDAKLTALNCFWRRSSIQIGARTIDVCEVDRWLDRFER